jgi:site-specific DNA-methyltransferase (adenine-specific)
MTQIKHAINEEYKSEVFLMDCMEGMKQFEDNYFDLAVCDIPYGLGDKLTSGGTWANKYSKGDADWDVLPSKDYFIELFRVSKNQIIWGGNYAHEYLPSNRHFIIWDKVSHMPTMADCEYAWSSLDRNAKIYKHPRNTTVKRIHITQKPISLYDWLFKNYAEPGQKILDTHLGSQSSRISANKNKLHFTGFELDPDYFRDGNKRYEDFVSQLTLF